MDKPRARPHATRALAALGIAVLLAAPLLPLQAQAAEAAEAAADACPSGSPAWFLGVVYDEAQRDDFRKDVRNFERYLATLRASHCIPAAQASILAFENGYTDGGITYPTASEAALRAELARFGAASAGVPEATLFVFLSSHGFLFDGSDASSGCPARTFGSFAQLKGGQGHDGQLHDCALGAALNGAFDASKRMVVVVDCSFCGGFSDSLTALSGTVPDNTLLFGTSGIPAANRIVITGCAMTTECFGGNDGGVTYGHLNRVLDGGIAACDGWSAPGFPDAQGVNAPARIVAQDGRCTMSEWFFAAVESATFFDLIGAQQQFRIKYGFADLASDVPVM